MEESKRDSSILTFDDYQLIYTGTWTILDSVPPTTAILIFYFVVHFIY